ncbi:beclin 1 [Pichia kluyveri]|uniref:Beclin 1 n=1 Tax=Pichia kluyveri TaxID=36015 RepID=A0AAV5RAT4_PICKL|nr:beclin 1 [Pichia kluyveri]
MYFCKTCHLPLIIDPSLNLSNAQQNLTLNYTANTTSSPPSVIIPKDRLDKFNTAIGHSFVYLNKHDDHEKPEISSRIDKSENIFDIISSKYDIDYPVCNDCAISLSNNMKHKYETLNNEKEVYLQFLKNLTSQNRPSKGKIELTLEELETLKQNENELMQQIESEDKLHEELNKEINSLSMEIDELKSKELERCKLQNQLHMENTERLNTIDKLQNEFNSNMDFLDNLRKTNVFDNFFEISTNGQFSTINGLRLGCLSDVKVTWHEINASLGHITLLLSTCLNILDFNLQDYKLIPMGSNSKIEIYKTNKKLVYQLYSTSEFSLTNLFSHPLDDGMLALLKVIKQIGDYIHTLDTSFILPYEINNDTIANYPIKPSAKSWENWTAACRLLLSNVKWIQTFCIAHYENIK